MYVDKPSDAPNDLNAPDILASPIISDNMIIISATYDTINLTGRLICIGDYTKNSEGTVKSTDIHVQKSKWWNKFYAEIINGLGIIFRKYIGDYTTELFSFHKLQSRKYHPVQSVLTEKRGYEYDVLFIQIVQFRVSLLQ